ncbi:MAG TPA: NAD-binding protein, partial [Solirubrobacteraceae bacterium]|nr:NAD-binding protein [Solirubrobacteraceae bacterium]
LVRHLDEDVPIVATIFDRAIAEQLEETVPGLDVTSLADIAAPSLAGPCAEDGLAAVLPGGDGHGAQAVGDDLGRRELHPPASRWARALLTSVFRPYDRSAALLFYGAMGLVLMLAVETAGAMAELEQSFPDALYGSTKSLATVGPNTAVAKGPGWFKLAMVATMLLTLLSAACFTGGLIDRLTGSRLTGLVGLNAVPRRDHVVVVGLGQVGYRLCTLLRECGIPVVVVEADEHDESVGHARRDKLPIVIGRGADPVVLRKLSLDRARALAAVTPDDLTNVEVAMTARSLTDDLRVVLRAGDGEVAQETGSLFRIGHVIDVHRVAAALIASRALGGDERHVVAVDGEPRLLTAS